MKYMLLTYLNETAWAKLSPAEQKQAMDECGPHVQKLMANKQIIGGAPLDYTSNAATVTVRGGKRIVTDGPFAETREQLGGYSLIEAKDQAEAIEIAAGFFGPADNKLAVSIEVRRVIEQENIAAG